MGELRECDKQGKTCTYYVVQRVGGVTKQTWENRLFSSDSADPGKMAITKAKERTN